MCLNKPANIASELDSICKLPQIEIANKVLNIRVPMEMAPQIHG